jgi:hypothetical protein
MPSMWAGSGYLLNDNRAAGEGKEEDDIGLCPHCQRVIRKSQWRACDGSLGWCARCAAPCCGNGPCAERFQREGCLPFLARIDKMLAEDYAKAQFRRGAGLDPEKPQLLIRPGMSS